MQTWIIKRWWLLQLVASLALVMGACGAEGLRLSYPTFTSTEGFNLLAPDEPFYNGSDPSFEQEAIWLTPDPRSTTRPDLLTQNVGRFVYTQPISFMPDRGASTASAVASFDTSFSFQIITTGSYGSCGDGFSFFVAASAEPPIGSYGYYLGLANGSIQADPRRHFFAVEFDTFGNFEVNDSSSSHIAININSLISVASANTGPAASAHNDSFPELDLYRNYTFTAWVAYNSSTHLIEVWATNSSHQNAQRPSSACVQTHYDLSAVFQEEMYVGFSAACGAAYEGNILYSWDFSMEHIGTTGLNAPTFAPTEEGFGDGDTLEKLPCHSCKRTMQILIYLLSVATVIMVIVVVVVLHKKKERSIFAVTGRKVTKSNALQLLCIPDVGAPIHYSYEMLRRACRGFDKKNQIGGGGSGIVYKAMLDVDVAIKRLKDGVKKDKEFSSELEIISRVAHHNLLKLKGWCYEKGEALLVYDYMPKGSLDQYVFGEMKGSLDSNTRYNILKGIAAALEYLHNGGMDGCILHRDVKAANVLLTENFEAKLGDFGLARLISHDRAVTMTAAGTAGYIAPEVVYTKKVTDMADVYSFGILALEVACGRSAIDMSMVPESFLLLDWVRLLHERNELLDALDPCLSEACHSGESQTFMTRWRCVLHVGLSCCHPTPEKRPTMRKVSQALHDYTIFPLPPCLQLIYPTSSSTSTTS